MILRLVNRLRRLGLDIGVVREPPPTSTFVQGVWPRPGGLDVIVGRCGVANLLHEAGHVAVIPEPFRSLLAPGEILSDALVRAYRRYADTHSIIVDDAGTEDPVLRGILQAGECEAIAWSYAAALEFELRPWCLFERQPCGLIPFEPDGDEVFEMLEAHQHFGIHGLQAAGFCKVSEFPKMRKWIA